MISHVFTLSTENSPVGYHTYNEILVTRQINAGDSGKNKYLINGVNVQKNKVEDFFQSVGLNINNPHFLIMQVTFVDLI